MREVLTFIISWIAVTSIFVFTFQFDGISFSFSSLDGVFTLWGVTSIFTGAYFLVVGIPILYFLFKRQRVTRKAFIFAGVIASIPMFLLVLTSGEIEWAIATIISGVIGGLIFAVMLANNQST